MPKNDEVRSVLIIDWIKERRELISRGLSKALDTYGEKLQFVKDSSKKKPKDWVAEWVEVFDKESDLEVRNLPDSVKFLLLHLGDRKSKEQEFGVYGNARSLEFYLRIPSERKKALTIIAYSGGIKRPRDFVCNDFHHYKNKIDSGAEFGSWTRFFRRWANGT